MADLPFPEDTICDFGKVKRAKCGQVVEFLAYYHQQAWQPPEPVYHITSLLETGAILGRFAQLEQRELFSASHDGDLSR